MNPALRVPKTELEAFCGRWGVAEVELFWSALGPAFGPDSDVDLLVSPRSGVLWSLFDEVRMRDELAELFGRPVDLLFRSAIERSSNWIRRAEILGSATRLLQRDDAALLDVLQAARRAEEFLGHLELSAFLADAKTQSVVLHQLLILGEAVKRLSQRFRDSHPEISWREIAGSRDVLIHAYDSVDLGGVWRAVTEDVPRLIASVAPLVPTVGDGTAGTKP